MGSTAESSTSSGLRRVALKVAGAVVLSLYTLQVALVIAFLLGLANSSAGLSLMVEGGRRYAVDSPIVLIVSAWGGPGEVWVGPIEVVIRSQGEPAVRPCRASGTVWFCQSRAPTEPGGFEEIVEARVGGSTEPIVFGVALEAIRTADRGELAPASELAMAPSRRGRSLAGRDIEPSVKVTVPEGDTCGIDLLVVPESGIAAANVTQGFWLHLAANDGTPAAGIAVECRAEPTEPVMRGVTDALGTATFERFVPWAETWQCSYRCGVGGAEAEREVAVNPSWDGISVAPARATGVRAQPAALFASHQRTFGGWYLSIVCDGSPTAAAAFVVEPGRAAFEWTVPAGGPSLQLCALQTATSPRGLPSSRTAHRWLLRAPEISERDAVLALAALVAGAGPESVRGHVSEAVRERLASVDENAVSSYGRFLLAALPQPWSASLVLTDGIAERSAVWEAERMRLGAIALRLLIFDVVLLLVGTAVVLVPPALRRRRALLTATDEEADETSEKLAKVTMVGAAASVFLALGVLAAFAVAMSTLLAAIW